MTIIGDAVAGANFSKSEPLAAQIRAGHAVPAAEGERSMKILTANRLTDGEAVWFSADQRWSETIVGAEIASDKDAEARLEAIGKAAYANNEVVDVEPDRRASSSTARSARPRLREQIRAAGPTNRNDLGKQARPAAAHAA